MIGAMALGQSAPCIESFAKAKGAGATVFEIIDTVSTKTKLLHNIRTYISM